MIVARNFFSRFVRVSAGLSAVLCLLLGCSGETAPPPADTVLADSTEKVCARINCREKTFRLDTFFRQLHKLQGMNGTVLVAQEGVVIYRNAFGIGDKRSKDSLSTHTSFQLASVSKQFTAAAIMLLHQQGKLNYSDSIRKFFPAFPYSGITVRQLLTHRSGLANYIYFMDEYYRGIDSFPKTVNNADVIHFMTEHRPAVYHQPDTRFDYSNTGYALLAAITEKISGMPFWKFMRINFFRPLNMNDSWITGDTIGKKPARAYYGAWKEWEGNFLDGVTGDKGAYSSVEDLFKWDQALYSGKILTAKTLEEAYTPASPEKHGSGYGYGWRTREWPDGKAVFHNGWWHGYTSAFYRGLSDKVTIIILCNKFNRRIYQVQPILEILGGNAAGWITEEETDTAKSGTE